MQGHVQSKLLLDDRHQDIDADGDPNLRPHSVLGGAVEALDAQVLLDPVWSKYWSEASISSIENLIALITVPVPHRRPG